jgi:hypothetical protein
MLAAATAALTMALPATAAAGPNDAALAKQVRALSKKVTVLQARVNTLEGALGESGAAVDALESRNADQDQAIAFVDDKDTCTTAITWDGLGLIVRYLTGSSPTRIDDRGACLRAGIVRTSAPSAFARGSSGGFLGGFGALAAALSR